MKKFCCVVLVLLGTAVFCAAEGIAEQAQKGSDQENMSYAFGMAVAGDVQGTGLEFNYDAFVRGFRDVMEKEKTRYTMDEAMEKIQTAFAAVQAEKAERNGTEGAAFLAENGKRPEVVTTASGLQYELVSEGTGEKPDLYDIVRVNYRGTTVDGTVFDTTYASDASDSSGKPVEIPLDKVIRGWSEGICMMKEGGKAKLYIPPNLAYGSRGAGNAIGPNTVIIFDVELLAIVKEEPKAGAEDNNNPADNNPDNNNPADNNPAPGDKQ